MAVTTKPDGTMQAEYLRAKVVMIANQMYMPSGSLANLQVNVFEDVYLRSMVMQMKTYILASGEEVVHCDVRFPENWMEAVKERWAPRWFRARWPVRYTAHELDRSFYRAMCPHLDFPKHSGSEIHMAFLKAHE
jgi:hypothetical protein